MVERGLALKNMYKKTFAAAEVFFDVLLQIVDPAAGLDYNKLLNFNAKINIYGGVPYD